MKELIEQTTIHSINKIKGGDFVDLLSPPEDGGAVATLMMPMEKQGAETRKNPIVFKNVVKKTQELLTDTQRESSEIGRLLEQLKNSDDESSDFWQHQQNGLAMVIKENGEITAFKTPFPLEEFTWVGKRPRLGRLMPLADGLRYYILALDLNKLRLFEATRWDVEEIPIEHGPTSLDEATKFDDGEKSLQHHTSGSPAGSNVKVDVIHHGQGGGTDDTNSKNIRRYFEMIDNNLAENFPDLNTSLVLFGPDSEVGHYREINSYPHLHEDDIRFNPSNQSDEELNKRMLDWVEEQADADARDSIRKLNSQIGQKKGTADLSEIVKAAHAGRIDTLYVKKGATRYGTYDPKTHTVSVLEGEENQLDENELIEDTVMHTTAAGGDVRYVSPGDLSEDISMAAAFRF